jgi:hypothetical protein
MYRIIGADGHEYGPINMDQLQKWIAEGRVNAATKILIEGQTEWQSLSDLPEFADLFANMPPPPAAGGPPPMAGPVNPEALAAEILARDYQVKIGDCLQRSWELIKNDFWPIIGTSIVSGLIASGGCIPYIGPLIGLIIGGPMMGGLYAFFLSKIRRRPVQFGDIFIGFNTAFVPLMLAQIVSGLLTSLGLILCLVPGIYLAVAWMFTLALVIDKKIDFWPAMELSRKVVTKHWWALFGMGIALGLVAIVGLLACCVGVIVTGTIAQVALIYAYEDIFGAPTEPQA